MDIREGAEAFTREQMAFREGAEAFRPLNEGMRDEWL